MVLLCFMNPGSQVNEMSAKAVGYHKVVEENRKLYNMVQDLKGWFTFIFICASNIYGHFLFYHAWL